MYRSSDPYLGVGIPMAVLAVLLAVLLPAERRPQRPGGGDGDGGGAGTAAPPERSLLELVRIPLVWTNNAQMLVVVTAITFWETFGSLYLHNRVGLSEDAVFWVFCGIALVYVAAALAGGMLEQRLARWSRSLLAVLTAVAAAGSLLLAAVDWRGVGPAAVLPPAGSVVPDTAPSTLAMLLSASLASYAVIAITCAVSVALVLPFTVVAMDHKNENELSSLHVFFMGSGQVFGAAVGGALLEALSFPAVHLVLGCVSLLAAVVLYTIRRRAGEPTHASRSASFEMVPQRETV